MFRTRHLTYQLFLLRNGSNFACSKRSPEDFLYIRDFSRKIPYHHPIRGSDLKSGIPIREFSSSKSGLITPKDEQRVSNGKFQPQSASGSSPESEELGPIQLNADLIHHLERTSLVGFDNVEGLHRLEQAIEFANQILEVDTTGVEPMSTVLEEIVLHLREDVPKITNRDDILSNSSITDEDYFVSPPGNIPLEADMISTKNYKIRKEL